MLERGELRRLSKIRGCHGMGGKRVPPMLEKASLWGLVWKNAPSGNRAWLGNATENQIERYLPRSPSSPLATLHPLLALSPLPTSADQCILL